MKNSNVQTDYDLVAENYAAKFRDEMSKKPFDRKMLEWISEKVGETGMICDLGCGPGQITGFLHSLGARVCGIDLSPEMIKQAKILPNIDFQTGDMTDLKEVGDNSFGGIASFYSIVNIPPDAIPQVFAEMFRVLRPEGVLLLAFHIGEEQIHLEEFLEKKVSLDFFMYQTAEIKRQLQDAKFQSEETIERDSYPETVEHQTRRAYIFARK